MIKRYWQSCQDNTMGKGESLQQMMLRKQNVHVWKNKAELFSWDLDEWCQLLNNHIWGNQVDAFTNLLCLSGHPTFLNMSYTQHLSYMLHFNFLMLMQTWKKTNVKQTENFPLHKLPCIFSNIEFLNVIIRICISLLLS